jgi:ABC-2 type transport system ATP-binding protein
MTSTDNLLIAATDLNRYYGERRVLCDVSLMLRRGEVLGFLGPNGAGKSTAMRILSGVLAPSSGAVSIAGIDLLEHPLQARRCLGFLPEQPPIYRELTVDEYLHYCAALHRLPRAEANTAVNRAKQRCGLSDVGARLLGNLSKGYQQRAGIAQAILHTPAVVILDEPTVGLDPIQIREIRTLIRNLRDEHGILLSTHILPEVQAICDRVILINRGRIVLDSPMSKLASTAGAWRLSFRRPPTAETLRTLTSAHAVQVLDDGRILLSGENLDPEVLTKLAVQNDWGLIELTAQGQSLEDLFVQTTAGDLDAEAA